MIAPDSLVRQKEEVQGEEEEGAAVQRKAGSTGTPTPGADAPTDPTRSGVSDAMTMRKHGRWCGVLIRHAISDPAWRGAAAPKFQNTID